jgi:hypothetical protein
MAVRADIQKVVSVPPVIFPLKAQKGEAMWIFTTGEIRSADPYRSHLSVGHGRLKELNKGMESTWVS